MQGSPRVAVFGRRVVCDASRNVSASSRASASELTKLFLDEQDVVGACVQLSCRVKEWRTGKLEPDCAASALGSGAGRLRAHACRLRADVSQLSASEGYQFGLCRAHPPAGTPVLRRLALRATEQRVVRPSQTLTSPSRRKRQIGKACREREAKEEKAWGESTRRTSAKSACPRMARRPEGGQEVRRTHTDRRTCVERSVLPCADARCGQIEWPSWAKVAGRALLVGAASRSARATSIGRKQVRTALCGSSSVARSGSADSSDIPRSFGSYGAARRHVAGERGREGFSHRPPIQGRGGLHLWMQKLGQHASSRPLSPRKNAAHLAS